MSSEIIKRATFRELVRIPIPVMRFLAELLYEQFEQGKEPLPAIAEVYENLRKDIIK